MNAGNATSDTGMKTLLSWAVLLAASLVLFTPSRAQAQVEVSFDYFYDALSPYGTWVEVEGYGPCWSPDNVDADWAPYTEGEWVYTDAGWTWQGDDVFSPITDHYGRWIMAGSQGWCWVPGYDWAPAWVSWRDGDDYVGWAPLPPEVGWDPEVGVGPWVDEAYGIGPSFYVFCHHRDFGERHLRTVLMARSWNTTILVLTRNITHHAFNPSRRLIVAGGLDYERAKRFASSPIASFHLELRNDYDFRGQRFHSLLPGGLVIGNSLVVVAPVILPMQNGHTVRPATHKVIAHAQINHGWVGKGASGNLDFVRRKISTEAQGRTPASDPVRPLARNTQPLIPQTTSGPIPFQPQSTTGTPTRAQDLEQEIIKARLQEAEAIARNQAAQAQQQREMALRQQDTQATPGRQQVGDAQEEQERIIRRQGAELMARRQAEQQSQSQRDMQIELRRREQAQTEAQQRAALEASRERARHLDFQHPVTPAVQSGTIKSREEEERNKKKK